jgi:nickel transport protein
MRPKRFTLLTASLMILLATATAWCHGISVFAWVEGELVHVESKFSGGKRPVNATVRVFDPEGKELLSGTTDDKGAWSFDLPQHTALKIVLEAGMGHRGEWTLSAEEVGAPSSAASENVTPQSLPSPQSADTLPTESTTVVPTPVVPTPVVPTPVVPTAEGLDARLRTVLAAELATVTARLAHLEARLDGPSLQDILGGLGYILGLVGIGAYVQARRMRDEHARLKNAPNKKAP